MRIQLRRTPKKKLGPRKRVWAIRRKELALILEAGRSTYPLEFSAVLAATNDGVIDDVLVIPGTISGDAHAILQFYNIPSGYYLAGSVHTHPSGVCLPSEADRMFFQKLGDTHIIAGLPFGPTNWRAFTADAEPLTLKVVDEEDE